jgi:hypothetical protein
MRKRKVDGRKGVKAEKCNMRSKDPGYGHQKHLTKKIKLYNLHESTNSFEKRAIVLWR